MTLFAKMICSTAGGGARTAGAVRLGAFFTDGIGLAAAGARFGSGLLMWSMLSGGDCGSGVALGGSGRFASRRARSAMSAWYCLCALDFHVNDRSSTLQTSHAKNSA